MNVTAYHVIPGLTPYHQRRHTPDAVLRVQCRVDLHSVGHAILHQLQYRVSGGPHVVIDEPTQCRRNTVQPGFVQHPLQPLFRYREGDKVQRSFCRLFLIRRFLLADQIIDKLAVRFGQRIAADLRLKLLLQLFIRMLAQLFAEVLLLLQPFPVCNRGSFSQHCSSVQQKHDHKQIH